MIPKLFSTLDNCKICGQACALSEALPCILGQGKVDLQACSRLTVAGLALQHKQEVRAIMEATGQRINLKYLPIMGDSQRILLKVFKGANMKVSLCQLQLT